MSSKNLSFTTAVHELTLLFLHEYNLLISVFLVLIHVQYILKCLFQSKGFKRCSCNFVTVLSPFARMMITEKELINTSTERFSLDRLYKEPSVSSAQMIDCCKRLLEESLPYLQGMHLCISHFYSVLQDGDLCIPWNWKN